QTVIAKNQITLDQIKINLGLLQQQQNQMDQALDTWRSVLTHGQSNGQKIAAVLIALGQGETISPDAEKIIDTQLKGWFRWQALAELYRRQGNVQAPDQVCQTPACVDLEAEVERASQQALVKLALLNSLPLLGGG
ncbi:hypothetical protein ACLNEE_17015, partial [Aphanothece stagnina RSMan2012]